MSIRLALLSWQPWIAWAMSSHAGSKHPAEHCRRGIYHWHKGRGGIISKTKEFCLKLYKCQKCSIFQIFLGSDVQMLLYRNTANEFSRIVLAGQWVNALNLLKMNNFLQNSVRIPEKDIHSLVLHKHSHTFALAYVVFRTWHGRATINSCGRRNSVQ